MKKIGVFVGSARRDSYSKAVAELFSDMMPNRFIMQPIDITDLPMFNQDYDDDGQTPDSWIKFRTQMKDLDGFLFVTPEYNRSYPPLLKNALDIASRPYGQNLWDGKPGVIVSVSPGRYGAFGANHHLRQVMTFLNVFVMQQPEIYLSNIDTLLNEDGTAKNTDTQKFLQSMATACAQWMDQFTK